jgi:prevent-host-death family protein
MKTTEWIITKSDLQHHPNIVLNNAKQRPLIVTNEGRPSAYVLSVDMFDSLLERLLELEHAELGSNIATGERQFEAGSYLTLKDAVAVAEVKWQSQESTS